MPPQAVQRTLKTPVNGEPNARSTEFGSAASARRLQLVVEQTTWSVPAVKLPACVVFGLYRREHSVRIKGSLHHRPPSRSEFEPDRVCGTTRSEMRRGRFASSVDCGAGVTLRTGHTRFISGAMVNAVGGGTDRTMPHGAQKSNGDERRVVILPSLSFGNGEFRKVALKRNPFEFRVLGGYKAANQLIA